MRTQDLLLWGSIAVLGYMVLGEGALSYVTAQGYRYNPNTGKFVPPNQGGYSNYTNNQNTYGGY